MVCCMPRTETAEGTVARRSPRLGSQPVFRVSIAVASLSSACQHHAAVRHLGVGLGAERWPVVTRHAGRRAFRRRRAAECCADLRLAAFRGRCNQTLGQCDRLTERLVGPHAASNWRADSRLASEMLRWPIRILASRVITLASPCEALRDNRGHSRNCRWSVQESRPTRLACARASSAGHGGLR
jgi:hypothetical protein